MLCFVIADFGCKLVHIIQWDIDINDLTEEVESYLNNQVLISRIYFLHFAPIEILGDTSNVTVIGYWLHYRGERNARGGCRCKNGYLKKDWFVYI